MRRNSNLGSSRPGRALARQRRHGEGGRYGMWLSDTHWPDIAVAAVVAGLGLSSARHVIRPVRDELRENNSSLAWLQTAIGAHWRRFKILVAALGDEPRNGRYARASTPFRSPHEGEQLRIKT